MNSPEMWYWLLHVLALGIVVGVLGLLHLFLKRADGLGIWGLVVGKDRRVSTSKLQVALWTVFIPAALLSIVLHSLYNGETLTDIGVGNGYLLLLGFPAAAAIGAKAITTAKAASGTKAKVEAPSGPDLRRGVADAVGDDEGNVEIFDLQYLLFNVVALVYFLVEFLPRTNSPLELPNIPEGLLILTSASAVGYLSKKTLERDEPHLAGVYPEAAAPGEKVWLRGVNLTVKAGPGAKVEGQDQPAVDIKGVSFGGREADMKRLIRLGGDEFEVFVPKEMESGPASVRVVREDGATTGKLDFRVLDARPQVRSVYPAKVVSGEDAFGDREVITILGSRFGKKGENGKAPGGAAVTLGGRPLEVRVWRDEHVEAYAPTEEEARKGGLDGPADLDLVVLDADGNKSDPQTVVLLPQPEKSPKPATNGHDPQPQGAKQG